MDKGYDVPLNTSVDELRRIIMPQQRAVDALQRTQAEVCKRIMGDQLNFVGTTAVARDVELIATRLDGKNAAM